MTIPIVINISSSSVLCPLVHPLSVCSTPEWCCRWRWPQTPSSLTAAAYLSWAGRPKVLSWELALSIFSDINSQLRCHKTQVAVVAVGSFSDLTHCIKTGVCLPNSSGKQILHFGRHINLRKISSTPQTLPVTKNILGSYKPITQSNTAYTIS